MLNWVSQYMQLDQNISSHKVCSHLCITIPILEKKMGSSRHGSVVNESD